MSDSAAIPYMTAEEYLEFEEHSQIRHEYVDGQVFSMTGGTQAHNILCVNLLAQVHDHLRGTGCRAFVNDVKVHVKAANSFYYPDMMVTCEPYSPQSVFTTSPAVIVEVLSRSTKQIDRREKLVAYRKLDSLKEYVIIHQYKMLVEFYQKDTRGQWHRSRLQKPDELCLESVPNPPLRIAVKDIYGDFEPPSFVEEEEEDYNCV